MATQLQFRRGTTAQNNGFTGAAGEVSIDTDSKGLRSMTAPQLVAMK
jgi:hypothetical protein